MDQRTGSSSQGGGAVFNAARLTSGVNDFAPRDALGPGRGEFMPRAAIVGALGLLTVFAFAPALGNGFVASWDDGPNFLKNPYYRGLGWSQFCWAWRATLLGVYQPLAWLLFSAEFAVWGLEAWGYHLFSILC